MNADAFRYFYEYHFAENRKTWDWYITSLTQEQFTQPVAYSVGSVRDHIVHLTNVEESWFSELRGVEVPQWIDPADVADRDEIRARWDRVEQMMRDYLATLRDEMLFEKPVAEGEDKDLLAWQMLLHVANHATDHRAQILRILGDLGVRTGPQDFMFYVYDHP
ncbi:MAG: DinB family protein [Chloroflexota bacterium]